MRTISILYDRLMRLHMPCVDAWRACDEAVRQIHKSGRLGVEVHGGWIFGRLTTDGVVVESAVVK